MELRVKPVNEFGTKPTTTQIENLIDFLVDTLDENKDMCNVTLRTTVGDFWANMNSFGFIQLFSHRWSISAIHRVYDKLFTYPDIELTFIRR